MLSALAISHIPQDMLVRSSARLLGSFVYPFARPRVCLDPSSSGLRVGEEEEVGEESESLHGVVSAGFAALLRESEALLSQENRSVGDGSQFRSR